MKVMFEFMAAIWGMTWYWRVWVAGLMLVNMLFPLFYIHTIEAKVVVVIFMLAAVTQILVFNKLGFVRLLGVGHVFWFPMLAWLLMQNDLSEISFGFMFWLWMLILLNSISLLIDVADAFRYWRGERGIQ